MLDLVLFPMYLFLSCNRVHAYASTSRWGQRCREQLFRINYLELLPITLPRKVLLICHILSLTILYADTHTQEVVIVGMRGAKEEALASPRRRFGDNEELTSVNIHGRTARSIVARRLPF